jgi:hypothetical protein
MSNETRDAWYKSTTETIGPFKCIKNKISKEIEINSRKGVISPYSDTHMHLLVIRTGAMKKFLPESKHAAKKGDEVQLTFPISELEMWAKRLGIVNNRVKMIERANAFGKPVDPNVLAVVEDDETVDVEEIETDLPVEQEEFKIAS